jgi:hypothetical protein
MIYCQSALYPLGVEDADEVIKGALDAVRAQDIAVAVGGGR